MRIEVQNQVLMLKGTVIAEVPPSDPERRKWLVITSVVDGVQLLEVEHDKDLDTDAWPAPEDMLDKQQTTYRDLPALLAALVSAGVDTEAFTEPWKTDYPF